MPPLGFHIVSSQLRLVAIGRFPRRCLRPMRRPCDTRWQLRPSITSSCGKLLLSESRPKAEVGTFEMRPGEVGAFETRPAEKGAFETRPVDVAARNDVRPDAQSRPASGAYWLRLERPSDAVV